MAFNFNIPPFSLLSVELALTLSLTLADDDATPHCAASQDGLVQSLQSGRVVNYNYGLTQASSGAADGEAGTHGGLRRLQTQQHSSRQQQSQQQPMPKLVHSCS
jgi:hypothetical protein